MPWHWLHPLAAWPPAGGACLAWAVLVALAADRLWGEPVPAWHPVVWMGRALGAGGARVAPVHETERDLRSFWLAALYWSALAAIILVVSACLQAALLWGATAAQAVTAGFAPWVRATAAVLVIGLPLGLLLKPLLALAMLQSEVRAVDAALAESLEAGRARLAWLVSRDVAQLSADEVRQSALESLAENLNDSVVAPIFWFALAGLPGAALYRFANTADAMWGYPGMRGGRYWQWAGKWAARADDVLSWLPARLTALLLVLVAGGVPLARLRQEARKTPSPNSGWPMAAMALALGVRLSKPGVYQLGADGRAPTEQDAERAQNLVSKVALTIALLALAAIVFTISGVRA